jgi:acyl-coenzyme A thioesterase PaaI-like protein
MQDIALPFRLGSERLAAKLELSVKFLDLATNPGSLTWSAHVVRTSRKFAFAEAKLIDMTNSAARPVAMASAMVAPAA